MYYHKNIIAMKKTALYQLAGLIGLLLMAGFALPACSDDDEADTGAAIVVNKVYLENADSDVPDREVSFIRLGQLMRLEGSGFTGMKKVYVNGYDSYFNPVYVSSSSMLVQVSRETPVLDVADNVKNTIRLVKDASSLTHSIEVRGSAPSVTRISHTMPQAGELITIYGTELYEIARVTFPGNVVADNGITSDDEEGKWCTVIVPAGITEAGAVLVRGSGGSAYSPAYFNFKAGLFHNFDDVSHYSWASGIDDAGTPLTDIIPAAGDGPKSQSGYQCLTPADVAANADTRYWTNSTDWPTALLSVIDPGTATSAVAVQMDIYVTGEWTTGAIRMAVADGWGATRYSMVYQPWYDKEVVPFENPGCWFTITMPYSDSDDFADKTFQDVVNQMNAATYKQSGPWFHNIGVTDVVEPTATSVKIFFDNLRVVPLNTPTFDEFAE
jgi:hypothetical protein